MRRLRVPVTGRPDITRGSLRQWLLVLLLSSTWVCAAQPPAGTLLVVNKSSDSLTFIDLQTGRARAEVATGEGPHEVAVAPDGQRALVRNYGTGKRPGNSLTLVDIARATTLATISLGAWHRPHGLAWLPDNRHAIVTAEQEGALLIVDISSGTVTRTINTGASISHMTALTPDGRRAFVANIGDGTLSVIDLEKGKLQATITTGKGTEGVAMSPDGRQVWVTNREENTVMVLDARSLKIKATLEAADFPIRVVISPDGKTALVSNAKSSSVDLFDAHSYRRLAKVSMRGDFNLAHGRWLGGGFGISTAPIGILIHPDGTHAYIANSYGGFIAILDLETRQVTGALVAGDEPDGLGFSFLTIAP